jgi:hypothetical protein
VAGAGRACAIAVAGNRGADLGQRSHGVALSGCGVAHGTGTAAKTPDFRGCCCGGWEEGGRCACGVWSRGGGPAGGAGGVRSSGQLSGFWTWKTLAVTFFAPATVAPPEIGHSSDRTRSRSPRCHRRHDGSAITRRRRPATGSRRRRCHRRHNGSAITSVSVSSRRWERSHQPGDPAPPRRARDPIVVGTMIDPRRDGSEWVCLSSTGP